MEEREKEERREKERKRGEKERKEEKKKINHSTVQRILSRNLLDQVRFQKHINCLLRCVSPKYFL